MQSTEQKTNLPSDFNSHMELARALWQETLQIDDIEADANFFSLGGHSLLGMDICARINKEIGANIALKDLIENPTIRDFAAIIPRSLIKESGPVSEAAKGEKSGPLSFSQFQTWYQTEATENISTLHHLPCALVFNEGLDLQRLRNAYGLMIEGHEALRTKITKGPRQEVISSKEIEFELLEAFFESEEEAFKDMAELSARPFSMDSAPLFRARLYKLRNGKSVLFNCFHHIIFDGYSYEVFYRSLSQAYCEGRGIEEETRFLDHAYWQNDFIKGDEFNKGLAEWVEKLTGAPDLDLPTDFPRPALNNGASKTLNFELSKDLRDKLETYSSSKGMSAFTVLYGAYAKMLLDYSGQEEAVLAVPMLGRPKYAQKSTIGFFANATAIRTQTRQSVEDFLTHIRNEMTWATERENIPFEKIKSAIKTKRDRSRTPLTQAFFSYQRFRTFSGLFEGKVSHEAQLDKDGVHTDIDAWIKHEDGRIRGGFEYRIDLFREKSVRAMFNYFQDLIEFICSGEESFKEFVSKSGLAELQKVNDNPEAPGCGDFLKGIEETAKRVPNTCAIKSHDGSMSYGEMWEESSRIAQGVVDLGIKPGELVGVSMERSTALMPTLLGVLRAGAGYVPLDPQFPKDRLSYMISQSKANLILADGPSREKLEDHQNIIKLVQDVKSARQSFKDVEVEGSSPAYVIYTSGSTGLPKGVRVSRKSATIFLNGAKKTPGFKSSDKMLAVTTLSFDISVLELFLPLLSGGSVYIASKLDVIDGGALKAIIEKHDINFLQATPPTWRLLKRAGFAPQTGFKALCGGETFPTDLAKDLVPLCGEVWNMYGPTEGTVWVSAKRITNSDEKILIGRPLPGYRLYTLDEDLRPVPFGAVGEIFVGGDCIASGYEGRPDLTNERFLFDTVRGRGRMYKTGDLGRFHSNGELECLGRNDDQVKVRGYRIELGEAESALSKVEGVTQVVAMAREDRPGDKRLVAYLTGRPYKAREIRRLLENQLPSYMIPANYIWLEEFPQTLNGKVDKKKLPPLEYSAERKKDRDAFSGDSDFEEFKDIWREVLGVEDLHEEDDFFDLGGNSLLSVELFALIKRKYGKELPLSTLAKNSRAGAIYSLVEEQIEKHQTKSIPAFCHSLVAIKEQGHKAPVFCFHGVGGNILNYLNLASAFHDRPVYGLQARGLDGKSAPLESIREMAQAYANEIQLVQPKGPYIFMGGSMGGLIALEAARVIKERGERVKKVFMFDTFGPNVEFRGYHKRSIFEEKLDYIKWFVKKNLYQVHESLLQGLGLGVPIKTKIFNIEVRNWKALWSHSYQRYDGDIELLRAPIEDTAWYRTPDMGWGTVVEGEVNISYIDCGHENFMEHPELPRKVSDALGI